MCELRSSCVSTIGEGAGNQTGIEALIIDALDAIPSFSICILKRAATQLSKIRSFGFSPKSFSVGRRSLFWTSQMVSCQPIHSRGLCRRIAKECCSCSCHLVSSNNVSQKSSYVSGLGSFQPFLFAVPDGKRLATKEDEGLGFIVNVYIYIYIRILYTCSTREWPIASVYTFSPILTKGFLATRLFLFNLLPF